MKTHKTEIQGPSLVAIKKQIKVLLAGGLLAIAGLFSAQADTLTWDPAFGGGTGGSGTWNLNLTTNWWNGASDVAWTDNSAGGTNAAVFSGAPGTVTLNTSLSASNLQFTVPGYTLSGSGPLTLGAGGIDASTLVSGTTTIGIALSLPVAQQPWQIGAGGALAVNGALTRSTGASVDFSATGITTTNPNLTNDAGGILDGWATSGNFFPANTTGDFLSVSNGNIVISTNYTAVSPAGNTTPSIASISGQNLVSGALNGPNDITTITNNVTINSLVQQGDFVVNDGVTVTIGNGGLIQRGISRWLIDQSAFTIGSAVLQSGLPSGEFFVHSPNGNTLNNGTDGGNWRIWPRIKDNGATPGILIKDGPGCAILQNTNTYSGGTIINNGILIAGGADQFVALAPVTLGSGTVTVNNHGTLEIGYGTGNASLDYFATNNVVLAGGKIVADDGHQHVSGSINVTTGGTLGSTYDGGGNGTTGNKALFIDGVVSGNGPLFVQQSVDAGDNDRYGNGGGNFYNSSVVEFGNNGNTYSGTITVIPYATGGGSGSYLAINGSSALQFATLNLANNPGGQRYAGVGGVFTPLIFNTGLGSVTVASITGSGNIILNGFNENTYAVNSDPITLSVGNNTSTTISGIIAGAGNLVKLGNSTLTLSGVNTYTGNTTISAGSIVLTGGWLTSSNIFVGTGRTLDLSAVSPATMVANQVLFGDGTVIGSLNAVSSSGISAGTDGTYGTNAITGSLTMGSGAVAFFDVGTAATGSNDLVTVAGTLTANNNIVHLKAPSTAVNLDSSADYVLISSPNTISGTFATTPTWDVAPLNMAHFSIVTGAKTVTLHYSTVAGPTGVGSSSPSPVLRNQNVLLTVTAANGTAGTVNSVVVDASLIGGSATLNLVNSGGNVWTNSVTVPSSLAAGNRTLVATVTDTAALTAFVNVPVSVAVGNDVWNGSGADDNISTSLNWTNNVSPALVGDSLQFAGSTRLTPNVDNNYIVTGVLFAPTAGAFNIGSAANSLTLTNGNGVVNNSPNVQTFSTPITVAAVPTLNTASNDIVVSSAISDGASPGGLTKTGNHALTLSGASTYTGPTTVSKGTLNVTGSVGANVNTASTFVGGVAGNSVLNITGAGSLSAFYLILGNATNSVGVVNQTAGTVNAATVSGFDNLSVGNVAGAYGYYGANGGTFAVNGICIGGEANNGGGANFSAPGGNGIMDVNGGAVTDAGWLVIGRQNGGTVLPSTGILNVYNGSLTYAGGGIVGPWDTGESAIINLMGGSVTSPSQGVRLGNTGFTGVLNLNGGLLEATEITGYNGPTFTIVNSGQLNFNGGTLQAAATSADFIRVTTANIYSGGATIDNNGTTVTVNQPLLAPAGKGVHGIASFTGGAGYIAPPIVTVANGVSDTTGNGATAIAQINPVTGTVTNVIITCPGINYTATPIFLLSGGGATASATITGTAPTANTSGGLTSIGIGLLSLTSSNTTYTGNTIVGAGTLELVNPVLASVSTLVVSNGAFAQLDFTGTNRIAGLVLNGVSQPLGVYNSTTSPTFITGSGSLQVATPIASNPTNITVSLSSGTLSLSWPVDHLGWILQQDTNNLNSPVWFDMTGSASITSTNIPINPSIPATFYRMRHP